MGIELQSQTRIVIGRLAAPSDPERPWWWQASIEIGGVDVTVAGFAATENDAILEAAASTIDLHEATDRPPTVVAQPAPDAWGLNGSHEPARDPSRARSTSG